MPGEQVPELGEGVRRWPTSLADAFVAEFDTVLPASLPSVVCVIVAIVSVIPVRRFEPVIAFPSGSISVQGELKTNQDTGDSEQAVYRRFCPNCGSGVIADVAVMPGLSITLAGTVDDPGAFTPTIEVFCNSAQPWFHAGGERTRFAAMPG